MIDYEKILLNLVTPMVSDPDSLSVRQMESLNEKEVLLYVYAKSDDLARLIGRKGSMATAISQMLKIASRVQDKKVTVKFESY